MYIADAAAVMPVHPYLLGICTRGSSPARPHKGQLPHNTPHTALSPVGRQRLRSRALMLTDFHTHHTDSPNAVIYLEPSRAEAFITSHSETQASTGIHPWNTGEEPDWDLLERVAAMPHIVAIGECGLDRLRGASPDRQTMIFRRQTELSERLGKPLIIHCVKAWDQLLALKKEIRPQQNWGIHGYRGGPELARQLTSHGIYLSLGERFNPATAAVIPHELLLAETDESHMPISAIITGISQYTAGEWDPALNLHRFLQQK